MEDLISGMPDEILAYILSFLLMREAAATSVLSKRWRNLWKSMPTVKFDSVNMLGLKQKQPLGTRKFVGWVNKILRLRNNIPIVGIRLRHDFNKSSTKRIKRLIRFAIKKKVMSLDLNFSTDINSFLRSDLEPFVFSSKKPGLSLRHLCLRACEITYPTLDTFKFLVSLKLSHVRVKDDIFDNFFSTCLHLETFYIQSAQGLMNLKVVGLYLSLRCIEIYHCQDLKKVEIYAPNLVSFKYYGSKINLALRHMPKLVEVRFGSETKEPYPDLFSDAFKVLATHCNQLETLILNSKPVKHDMRFGSFPKFSNLKVLALVVDNSFGGVIGFPSLLEACPVLHRFELHLNYRHFSLVPSLEEVRMALNHPHQHLKELELSGFHGLIYDIELVKYFVKVAVALKKITIITHNKLLTLNKWICDQTGTPTALARAELLYGVLPLTVDLVII